MYHVFPILWGSKFRKQIGLISDIDVEEHGNEQNIHSIP